MITITLSVGATTASFSNFTDLGEKLMPIMSKNYAQTGTMYVDYIGNRRVWRIDFDTLSKNDYDSLRAVYDAQFSTASLATLEMSGDYTLSSRSALLELPAENKLKWNGQYLRDFSITVEERNAL